jgi:hypothetical protein
MHIEAVAFDDERRPSGRLLAGIVPVDVLSAVARHRGHLAAPHGDGRAGVERCLRGRLARARFERLLIEVAVPTQPGGRALCGAIDDRFQILRGRRSCRVEQKPAPGVPCEHAIENGKMEVTVEVQAAEPLNEVDRTTLCLGDPFAFRPRAIAREDALEEDAGGRGEHVGLERDELAKLVGQRQHVLP